MSDEEELAREVQEDLAASDRLLAAAAQPPDRLLEVRHVAFRLSKSHEYVRRLIYDGKLKGLRVSDRGPWRVRESALNDFIREREAAADAELKPQHPITSKKSDISAA